MIPTYTVSALINDGSPHGQELTIEGLSQLAAVAEHYRLVEDAAGESDQIENWHQLFTNLLTITVVRKAVSGRLIAVVETQVMRATETAPMGLIKPPVQSPELMPCLTAL